MIFSAEERQCLLTLARESIRTTLVSGRVLQVNSENYSFELQQIRASFVTLHINNKLRGCIGSLEASESLAADVARHAHAAAFADPRFPPLTRPDLEKVHIEISVLSPQIEISCVSEADLIAQLRPGIDGLTLRDGKHHGTFLPSVWEQLPDKHNFLCQLKIKSGLPQDYWSDNLRAFRYTTTLIEEAYE
jgi:hypothetical protein